MKEIKQGTLFGFDLVLKVPEDYKEDEVINKNTLERYIKQEKLSAVKDSLNNSMDFQQLASAVPRYYSMHPVYQSVWVGGKEIEHGMSKRDTYWKEGETEAYKKGYIDGELAYAQKLASHFTNEDNLK